MSLPSEIVLDVNGAEHTVAVDPSMPLLWVLREQLGLTGAKYGCGIAQCGACKVLVQGEAVPSCSLPVSAATGKSIVTIEGLSREGSHPVQRAWLEERVPQCGYCQPGQIIQATDLLRRVPDPDDDHIDLAMSGNLCRCGTYVRIRRAIKRAATILEEER